MVGRTVSHYRIVAELGSGGMGVVYRADDLKLGRAVALKFISAELADQEQAFRRLHAEARAASALNHPNICTIYDIDEHEGHPFIVMELMKGRSLRDKLSDGILKTQHLVDIGIECADALHAAHSEGIVHRDIKPGNVFLTENGHVKLLDFGVAKLAAGYVGLTRAVTEQTAAGMTVGTVAYMSPEQATGEELDARTDLFSLGVVLYECATGHHPFPGKTSGAILAAIINRAPTAAVTFNPELPQRLQEVLNNCLEKDRELRYQSAADLRADLRRVRRDIQSGHSGVFSQSRTSSHLSSYASPEEPTGVASASRTATPQASSSRRRALLVAAIVVAVAIAAGVFYARRPFVTAPVETTNNPVTVTPSSTIERRLAQANAALQSRNYAAALTYADEVLTLEPGHQAATKIRNEAQSALARLNAAIADAQRRIASHDMSGAAKSLEAAREIDPTSARVGDVAALLAEQTRANEPTGQGVRQRAGAPPARAERAPTQALPPPPQRRSEPAANQSTPPTEAPPVEPTAKPPRTAPAPPSAPVPAPPSTTSSAAPSPTPTPPPAVEPAPVPAKPAVDEDDVAIRNVIATYGRAIESKDLGLFRLVKPNLSREEERRLQEGFRAVTSQHVTLTILSIDRRGDRATVLVRRRDVIQAGARQQEAERQQTLTLARSRDGWVISEIR